MIISYGKAIAQRMFVMDGIYADEVISMVNAAKNFSPRLEHLDNREVVSILMEIGMAAEKILCEKRKIAADQYMRKR